MLSLPSLLLLPAVGNKRDAERTQPRMKVSVAGLQAAVKVAYITILFF